MSRLLRLGLVFLFLLFPPGALVSGGWSGNAATRFDISRPPGAFTNWVDDKLDPLVLREIQPDKYLRRNDVAAGGSASSIYVAFYSGYGTTSAHDPAVCFPSQGWDLSQVGYREVPLPNDESFTAQLFRATEGRHESLVLYWFQPAGRWTQGYPEEMLLRVYDAFSGRKQYAFVQLTTPLVTRTRPGAESNGEAEQEVLEKLASDLAPWVRSVLEGH